MNFPERLKDLRAKKGFSQEILAKMAGVHHTQIGRYERGESVPSSKAMQKLSNAMGVSADFLLNGQMEETATHLLHDKELLHAFKEVEKLEQEDKVTIKALLDAFLTKRKLEALVK